MNSSEDIPLSNGVSEHHPCGITSILPTIGMSCRGRAESFARRLQSKLRTLGSQSDDSPTSEEDPIMNGLDNTWLHHEQNNQNIVTAIQPLRHNNHTNNHSLESDSYFDFDCEIESPGSPVDECEYSRLIETTSNTPHECEAATAESGYQCSSPITPGSRASSQSSDGPYYDPESSDGGLSEKQQNELDTELTTKNTTNDSYDVEKTKKLNGIKNELHGITTNHQNITNGNSMTNGKIHHNLQNGELEEYLKNQLNSENSSESVATPVTQNLETEITINSSDKVIQEVVLNELQQISAAENQKPLVEQEENNETEQNNKNNDESMQTENLTTTEANNESEIIVTPSTPENDEKQSDESPKETQSLNKQTTTQKQHLSDSDDEDDCRPQRVRRCSSLKSGKTPPGTPGHKKIVRFADVLGLDLADVKTFMDEIPNIPRSAYQDLEIIEIIEQPPVQLGPKADRLLMPMFQQPGALPAFLDAVRDKQVNLENVTITDHINLIINGSVRVRNLDFHKSVHIRYTYDSWRTFVDLPATYVQNSCDGFSDIFLFTIYAGNITVGQRLEFAIRFQCKGQQFWDNNYGSNYCFQCLPTNSQINRPPVIPTHHTNNHTSAILSPLSSVTTGDPWCASFY